MSIWVRNALRRQGMTEIFFESEEPSFDELTPAQFFARFPAGIYEAEATTLDGEEMEAEIRVSHVCLGPLVESRSTARTPHVTAMPRICRW